MKSDDRCECGATIRWAVHDLTGARIALNATADIHGNIGVVRWGTRTRTGLSTPHIAVNPTGPTETPHRYTTHSCS